jgi:hypothetical protein
LEQSLLNTAGCALVGPLTIVPLPGVQHARLQTPDGVLQPADQFGGSRLAVPTRIRFALLFRIY